MARKQKPPDVQQALKYPFYETITQFVLLGLTVYLVIARPPYLESLINYIVNQLPWY
jgi:hypothetical protein